VVNVFATILILLFFLSILLSIAFMLGIALLFFRLKSQTKKAAETFREKEKYKFDSISSFANT